MSGHFYGGTRLNDKSDLAATALKSCIHIKVHKVASIAFCGRWFREARRETLHKGVAQSSFVY